MTALLVNLRYEDTVYFNLGAMKLFLGGFLFPICPNPKGSVLQVEDQYR